jgi:DNA-binding CsgD family transcriptional regulator
MRTHCYHFPLDGPDLAAYRLVPKHSLKRFTIIVGVDERGGTGGESLIMAHSGHAFAYPGGDGTLPRAPGVAVPFDDSTTESLLEVPRPRPVNTPTADFGQLRTDPFLPVPVQRPAASPRSSRTREDGVEQATLVRRGTDEPRLNDDEVRLLAQIASGVTADVAARKLELSARTLRRRLRTICDRLGVNTPIEAVVWAARRQLI